MVSSNKNNNVSYQTTIKQLGYQHFKGLQSDLIDNVFFFTRTAFNIPKAVYMLAMLLQFKAEWGHQPCVLQMLYQI